MTLGMGSMENIKMCVFIQNKFENKNFRDVLIKTLQQEVHSLNITLTEERNAYKLQLEQVCDKSQYIQTQYYSLMTCC